MGEEPQHLDAAPTGADDEESRAVDAALSFLSYRPRTSEEIRRKLVTRDFSEKIIAAALERLDAVRLVDDEAFVASYVRDRIAHRPMGVRRMTNELYVKGVSREVALPVIESVLQEEEVDERVLARRAAERVHRTIRERGEPEKVMRRLLHHLIRRGFSPEVAKSAVAAMF